MLTMYIVGLEGVQAKFAAMGDRAGTLLEAVVMAGAKEIENEAKALVPKRSRTLWRSITTTVLDRTDTAVTVGIGTQEPYGKYVEFGTGEYADPEGGGSKAKQIPWRYQAANGSWVTTKGNRPQPFLRPAYDTKKDEATKSVGAAMEQIMSKG